MDPSDRMHDLVDALSDRSISGPEAAELNRRLETDSADRVRFMNLMRLEAELGAIHQPLASWSLDPASIPTPMGRTHPRRSVGFLQFLGALAASIAITAVCSSLVTYRALASVAEASAVSPAGESVAVARVAATRNCRWVGGRTDLGFGAGVAQGQTLELETGLAELTFDGGARLVLEGPASFRIDDGAAVEVFHGRVAAAIPESAKGFCVRTPRMVVAESGAQYGVVAGADGADEVHVFEGVVKAKALDQAGRVTSVVNLASLEGARVASTTERFATIDADDAGFVRSLDTRTGPGNGLLAFDNFSYPTGPLAWQNGGFGWAGPWVNIESAPGADDRELSTNGVVRGSIATSEVVALGNRFVQSGNYNRVRRTLSTSIGGVFDAAGYVEVLDGFPLVRRSGGTIYMSFMQRTSKVDDVFYGLELHRGDGNYNRVLCIGSGVEKNGYGVSVNFLEKPGKPKFVPLGEEDDRVNFLVVRIDFGVNDRDTVTVYRNPESLTDESACGADARLDGHFSFDRVSIGNFQGTKVHEVDEVRIGTDFQAVTGGGPSRGVHTATDTRASSRKARVLTSDSRI